MLSVRRVRGPRALPIVGAVFIVVGLIGLAAAALLAGIEGRSRHTAVATGRIAETGSFPIIEFKTADGSIVRFTNSVRSSLWRAGDTAAIAYDPENPSDAVVDGLLGRWFLAALAGLLGSVFFVVGVLLNWIGRAASRRN